MNMNSPDAQSGASLLGWHPSQRIEGHMANKKEIMVVDDETSILMLIEISLKRSGFEVITVDNPFRALDLLEESTPDLLILDMMMPGMDGLELCQKIRSRPQTAKTPVIVFSALNDSKNREISSAAGANAFITKSEQRELVSKIKSLLGD
jgi:CheY-like chemotaxis protein